MTVCCVALEIQHLVQTDSTPGNPLGHSLWKIPNRRFHPEYYTIVKKPISMAQIQKKLKKGDYANITDMTADLYQMCKLFSVDCKIIKNLPDH